MNPEQGKVPQFDFLVVVWVFYGLSIAAASARTLLRVRTHKGVRFDDVFLILACATLTAATILLHLERQPVYQVQAMQLNPQTAGIDPTKILSILHRFEILNFIYLSLTWITIFSVKFAFLNFFGQLVERVPAMIIYWKVAVAYTTITFLYCLSHAFIACPYLGFASLKCTSPSRINRSMSLAILTICLDISSDIMIVAIPMWVILKVKLKPKRKLGLATFLCLQVLMATMAVVRVSGIKTKGTFDNPWVFLWQQVEACVAVSMNSFTAFRSVFIHDGSQARKSNSKYWYSSAVGKILKRRQQAEFDRLEAQLPVIPSATLTGIQTFIHGGRKDSVTTSVLREDDYGDEIPLQEHTKQIKITDSIQHVAHLSPDPALGAP